MGGGKHGRQSPVGVTTNHSLWLNEVVMKEKVFKERSCNLSHFVTSPFQAWPHCLETIVKILNSNARELFLLNVGFDCIYIQLAKSASI